MVFVGNSRKNCSAKISLSIKKVQKEETIKTLTNAKASGVVSSFKLG